MRDKKAVKAGRPAFFSDPEIDRLLAIIVRLMTEHSVLTERVKVLESLLIESGAISRDGLEAFEPCSLNARAAPCGFRVLHGAHMQSVP